jgi:mannose-6-phosphate isomerase-like protein (cupin superfamily)
MAQGKYAKYVTRIGRSTGPVDLYHVGKMAVPNQRWDKTCFADTTQLIEIYHVYAAETGFGFPIPEPIFYEGEQVAYEDETWAHAHPYDEKYLFLGTNPDDPDDLGGEVECWLGEGKEAEKFIINKASCVVVPAGLVHNPIAFRKVDRTIIMEVISDTTDYSVSRWTKPSQAFKAFPPDED